MKKLDYFLIVVITVAVIVLVLGLYPQMFPPSAKFHQGDQVFEKSNPNQVLIIEGYNPDSQYYIFHYKGTTTSSIKSRAEIETYYF